MMGNTGPVLSVVMPCFNEEATIREILEKVTKQRCVGEVIVIDDGSTDKSVEIILNFSDPRIKLIKQPKNMGKGAAIRTGYAAVSLPFVIIQDADLEYNPEDYLAMLDLLVTEKADVVLGSRFLTSGPRRAVYYWHRVGNGVITLLSNAFTNLYLTDIETCYKMMKSEYARALNLQENRFGLEPEIVAKLAALDPVVYEVPIQYVARTYKEGKKIGWKDGVSALRCIVKYSSPVFKKQVRNNYAKEIAVKRG
jgi:glycosyltransferase involved in cell wall biosynthesis